MKRYKLAIFDFDGTLADSFPWFIGIINDVADKFGFRRVEKDEIETLRGADTRRIVKELKIPAWKMPLVARYMQKKMAQDIAAISLFPGIDQALKELASKGIRLAIVSSNSAENVKIVLGPETAQMIEYYVCGADLFGKSRKFSKVLRQSGISAAETICIGDEIRDLLAAREAKIDCGAVCWGYARADALLPHAPEMVFREVGEISKKLSG